MTSGLWGRKKEKEERKGEGQGKRKGEEELVPELKSEELQGSTSK